MTDTADEIVKNTEIKAAASAVALASAEAVVNSAVRVEAKSTSATIIAKIATNLAKDAKATHVANLLGVVDAMHTREMKRLSRVSYEGKFLNRSMNGHDPDAIERAINAVIKAIIARDDAMSAARKAEKALEREMDGAVPPWFKSHEKYILEGLHYNDADTPNLRDAKKRMWVLKSPRMM
jgi:hypothetical protein